MHTPQPYSLHDYAEVEASSARKFELLNGQIIAVAGGTLEHGGLSATATRLIGNQLTGSKCRVYSSDVRVGHEPTDFRAYPDGLVICGPAKYAYAPPNTVINPLLVIEVTSDSIGSKLRSYQKMTSLQGILIISHRTRQVSVHRRHGVKWAEDTYSKGESFEVPGLPVQLSVDELYDDAVGSSISS